MTNMIEREFKAVISEDMLARLLATLGAYATPSQTLQVNYYYDTPDFVLHQLNSTLRVRQNIRGLKLQYKYDKYNEGTIRTCTEFEIPLDALPLSITSKELPDCDGAAPSDFVLLGSLVTQRVNYTLDGAIVSLDTNFYLGRLDHEIEVEHPDNHTIQKILALLELSHLNPQGVGKYSRFVNALTES